MQWVSSFFTKKTSESEPEHVMSTDEVIQSLKLKRIQLMSEAQELETDARQYNEQGNRPAAINALKRKNVLDKRLKQIEGQIQNQEQYNITLESAAEANDIANSMKHGMARAQASLSKLDVCDVDEMVDEMEDLSVQAFDVTEALARPTSIGTYTDIDLDDKIAAQLAEWSDKPLELPDPYNPVQQNTPIITKNKTKL